GDEGRGRGRGERAITGSPAAIRANAAVRAAYLGEAFER
ncbi:hypothetical protein, partial [Burkholderia pseudomallei]